MVELGQCGFRKKIDDGVALMVLAFTHTFCRSLSEMCFHLGDGTHFVADVGPKATHGVPVTQLDIIGVMNTPNYGLTIRHNVCLVAGPEFIDRHHYSHMFGSHSGLREAFRQGVLESPANRMKLYVRSARHRKNADVCEQA